MGLEISAVSNVRDEEGNLQELHRRITKTLDEFGRSYEVIYVENGSQDASLEVLKSLSKARVLSLRVPQGSSRSTQSAALDAGIKAATGRLIITIDSDLQNPPEEMTAMVEYLEENNLDVVSGWRRSRKDNATIRYLSRFGSILRGKIIDPGVHDLGCTLKVYKNECFDGVDLYGEMHRYIVAILRWRGFEIGEMVVGHAERTSGATKYNWRKMFRGFVDMWLIWFTMKFDDRPLHLFGVGGLFMTIAGGVMLFILAVARLFEMVALSTSIWPTVSVLLIIAGMQLFVLGLLMDYMIRLTYKATSSTGYIIKEDVTNS